MAVGAEVLDEGSEQSPVLERPNLVAIEGGAVVRPGLPGVEIETSPDMRPLLVNELNDFLLSYTMDPGFDRVIDALGSEGVYIWELTDEEKEEAEAEYGLGLHVKRDGATDARLIVIADQDDEFERMSAEFIDIDGERKMYKTSASDELQPSPALIGALIEANGFIAWAKRAR